MIILVAHFLLTHLHLVTRIHFIQYMVLLFNMRRKLKYFLGYRLAVFSVLFFLFPLSLTFGEPKLTESQVRELRELPNSVGHQQSLVVRSRHVDSVRFYGASHTSRSGYAREVSIKPEGLWLDLKIQGMEPWSRAVIVFVKDFDVSKYNSLVLWLRANQIKKKIFVGLDDVYWPKKDALQVHTISFPVRGFPP